MSEKRAPALPSADPTMVGDDFRSRQASAEGTGGDATVSDREDAGGPAPDQEFARGTAIGRYIVLGIAGYGGMGVVYRAYDPELHREVAVKLLRADRRRSKNSATAEERLRREAQAMARVSHPNVLPVYDVGTASGRVFVAMEYCSVPTLAEWLEAAPRTWRATLDVFVAAGRGLMAAHAVGLLHRDFKPQNVFVGADGRVRVTDFGLARVLGGPMTGEDTESDGQVQVDPGDSQLTLAGSVVGTPRYMAPEQHLGRALDARSDQFSFCVALYEALFKVVAYGAGNIDQLAARKLHGDLIAPDSEKVAPRWVRRVVERGLAGDAAKRWPNMEELLAALEYRRRGVVRRRAAVLIGSAVLATFAAVAFVGAERPCRDAERKLDGVWDDEQRDRVANGIDATGVAFAAETRERVVPRINTWTEGWIAAHTSACEATKVHGEQSTELLDLRVACLDRARGELDALVSLLARADRKVVERAVVAADRLPDLESCADTAALLGGPRPPSDPELRSRVETIERALADGRALESAGKYVEAVALLERVAEDARVAAHPPLVAEAVGELGDALESAGDPRRSRALLVEALTLALSIDAPRTAESMARSLVYVDGYDLRDPASAHDWARVSEGLAVAAGADHRQEIALVNSEAVVYAMEGNLARAKELFDRALMVARTFDPEGANMGVLAGNAGGLLAHMGDYATARVYLEEALEIHRVQLGPRHPLVGQMLANLGALANFEGRYEDSQALLEQARQLQEEVIGTEHLDLANTYNNLAGVKRLLGDTNGAIDLHRKALAIREGAAGGRNLTVAQSLDNLSIALAHAGRAEEARPLLERSLAIKREIVGEESAEIAQTLMALSEVERAAGRDAEGIALLDRAIALRDKALGVDHPLLVVSLYARAQLLERTGRIDDAVADLERAAGIGARRSVDAVLLADVRWTLGRAIWQREPARARALVEQAHEVIAKVERREGARADDLQAWLATHRAP